MFVLDLSVTVITVALLTTTGKRVIILLMIGYILLATTLGLPLLLGVVCRVGAPQLFFSIMAGELLARYFGPSAGDLLRSSVDRANFADFGALAVLVAPLLLTAIFLHGSMSRRRTILHILPLAITGVVFAAFSLPLLPLSLQLEINQTLVGSYILNLNNLIIGFVVILQLIAFWLLNQKTASAKRRRRDKSTSE